MKRTELNLDERYMLRCLQLALGGRGATSPNPMVGAVIVHEGRIIGEGFHRKYGEAHAEVNAIASVRQPELLPLSTIYVSLEPCAHYGKTPPCADLIVEKRLRRAVIGCRDPFSRVNGLGIRRLEDAGLEVKVGVLESECQWLNRKFFTFHQLHRPYITLKWAQSRDGFIAALEDGSPTRTALSSPVTQALSHQLRAETDAILVGRRTAEIDNPSLTTRLWAGRNPLRLVIDPKGSLPGDLHLFDGTAPTRAYVLPQAKPAYEGKGAAVVRLREGEPMLQGILSDLAAEGVESLLVEGGSQTLQAFIDSGFWDEIRAEKTKRMLVRGLKAPRLPASNPQKIVEADGSLIETYTRRQV
ncbi:MAG: bifunctional diaminohydroxyphosphoribosylaminopyrimidine deaminase/5-amino-6-(5-phosphoribosylamino)uracil reductase RibD [Prevotellaceae bacterium]|nr:bifunctional diaminohydroxyphosphoribosylaminopyrimidine deaminase/5-amino-6-(5-phosphoribosylamino)uracil reductase RibD [Prevotellaceae bacterium]